MIIPILIRETAGIERAREPVAVGVPFSRGQVLDINSLRIRIGEDEIIPFQVKILGRWPGYPVAIPIRKEWPMNDGKTVFSQLFEFLPLHDFRKCVRNYRGGGEIAE